MYKLHDQSFMSDAVPREHWYVSDVWTKNGPDTPVTFYTDAAIDESPHRGRDDVRRVAVLLEPRVISNTCYALVEREPERFDLVCSHDRDFVEQDPVRRAWYPYGMTWVGAAERGIAAKTREVSLIASAKSMTDGHRLRHAVAALVAHRPVDVCGGGYRFVARKSDMLAPYRFSIVTENCRVRGLFTEKFVDCVMTGTVPIYWGCPDVGTYFDVRGLIVVETLDDVMRTLARLEHDGFASVYEEMLPYVRVNYERAQAYLAPDRWILEHIITPRGWA